MPGLPHGAHGNFGGAALCHFARIARRHRRAGGASHRLDDEATAVGTASGRGLRRGGHPHRHSRTHRGRRSLPPAWSLRHRRAASLWRRATFQALGEEHLRAARTHHDRDAHTAHPGHDRLRRSRRVRHRRATARPQACQDRPPLRRQKGRAVHLPPHRDWSRASGLRGLPPDRGKRNDGLQGPRAGLRNFSRGFPGVHRLHGAREDESEGEGGRDAKIYPRRGADPRRHNRHRGGRECTERICHGHRECGTVWAIATPSAPGTRRPGCRTVVLHPGDGLQTERGYA